MVSDAHDKTALFRYSSAEEEISSVREILQQVYAALQERGYNPFGQIVGYLISGDPTFITSHNNARTLIARLERDTILEELVRHYLK